MLRWGSSFGNLAACLEPARWMLVAWQKHRCTAPRRSNYAGPDVRPPISEDVLSTFFRAASFWQLHSIRHAADSFCDLRRNPRFTAGEGMLFRKRVLVRPKSGDTGGGCVAKETPYLNDIAMDEDDPARLAGLI